VAEITITVPGKPIAKGSAKWVKSKSTGKSVPTRNEPLAEWQARVSEFAQTQCQRCFDRATSFGGTPWAAPIYLEAEFRFIRPKHHYKGGNRERGTLKHGAPAFPIGRPDRGKLLRCIEDALTGIVYVDDAQVVKGDVSKVYGTPGVTVWISRQKSLA
jgi:Holliday junction resolvase RusA-like endonuclease